MPTGSHRASVENSSSTTGSAGTDGSSSSTGLRLDLGDKPDLEPPQPAGCKGKIDFLFVISSGGFVEGMKEQLIDAFPKFIETIQAKSLSECCARLDTKRPQGPVRCSRPRRDLRGPPPYAER